MTKCPEYNDGENKTMIERTCHRCNEIIRCSDDFTKQVHCKCGAFIFLSLMDGEIYVGCSGVKK
jgi:hypothetical protein